MATVTDPDKGTVTGVTDPKGQTVSYQYDALRRKTKASTTLDGKEVRTEYGYDAQTGYLSEIKHNTKTETSGDVSTASGTTAWAVRFRRRSKTGRSARRIMIP